ncbi:MAG: baaA1 [Parcubacteria group bacterium]|nr:baaA1 [Parcubacteria group bacterium]
MKKLIVLSLLIGSVVCVQIGLTPHKALAAEYVVKTGTLPDSTAGGNQRKLVRTSNGDLHTVYHRINQYGFQQIYYAKSTDGGQTWTESTLEDPTTIDSISHDNRPSIVSDSQDNLYVIWWGKSTVSSTTTQIRYAKYTHSTHQWSVASDLTNDTSNQNLLSATVDSQDNVYVVWNGKDASTSPNFLQIRYMKYTASSSTWSGVTNLTSGNLDQNRPFISVDYADNLDLVWFGRTVTSTTTDQIRFMTYSGGSWSSIKNVTSNSLYQQDFVTLGVDSLNNVHVAWRGTDASSTVNAQIKYAKYTRSNDTWGSTLTFTTEQFSRGQYNTYVEADASDNIYIAWNGIIGSAAKYAIRYVKYTSSSNTWSSPTALTTDVVDNQYPNLIWYINPIINGARVNRPKSGFAFVWGQDTTLKIQLSSDLSWDIATPTALVVTKNSPTEFVLSWTDTSSNEAGFKIERKSDTGSGYGAWTEVGTVATSTVSFIDNSTTDPSHPLQANARYQYQVRAYNEQGYSEYVTDPTEDSTTVAPVQSSGGHHSGQSASTVMGSITNPAISSSNASMPTVINRILYTGLSGVEVITLQTYLINHGYAIPAGATGYFGAQTRTALASFQRTSGISPAVGYFGPLTRAWVAAH